MKKKINRDTYKITFYCPAIFGFGKVRESVGEIKHTFDPTSNTPVPY